MFIDSKTQQNTICLNPLLRLTSSPLNWIQDHLRNIGIISQFQWLIKTKSNLISLYSNIPWDDDFGDFNDDDCDEVNWNLTELCWCFVACFTLKW